VVLGVPAPEGGAAIALSSSAPAIASVPASATVPANTFINVATGSSGSASFTTGSSITLSVTNGRDAIWSGACSSGGNKRKTCTFTINGAATVNANVQQSALLFCALLFSALLFSALLPVVCYRERLHHRGVCPWTDERSCVRRSA
jgi:hypothetical protein